jgi:hypothetical protein
MSSIVEPIQGLRNVTNQMAPPEGPKALPIMLDFSALPLYTLDFGHQQSQGKFSAFQSIYIDNSLNGSSVSMLVNGSGQVITCPANSQGYFPVICQNPISLQFTSAGNVRVNVYLCNFPIAPAVWHV